MSNPFTDEIVGWAKAAQRVYQIPASLNLSAAMLESSLGAHTPPHTNNWHGIKDPSNTSATPTREQAADGSWYTIAAGFRIFKTPADSFMYYAHLLGLAKPYHDMVTTFLNSPRGPADVQRLSRSLTGVYASAHDYGDGLIKIQQEYNLYQYDADVKPAPTPPAPVAPPQLSGVQTLETLMNFLPVIMALVSEVPALVSEFETLAQDQNVQNFIKLIEGVFHISPPTAGAAALLEMKNTPTIPPKA